MRLLVFSNSLIIKDTITNTDPDKKNNPNVNNYAEPYALKQNENKYVNDIIEVPNKKCNKNNAP